MLYLSLTIADRGRTHSSEMAGITISCLVSPHFLSHEGSVRTILIFNKDIITETCLFMIEMDRKGG